jgi:hypothetical protein
MNNSFFFNIILAFAIMLVSLMFLEGIWGKKGKMIKSYFDIDKLFFPNIKDKKLFKAGNQFAFVLCILMSVLTLINGVLCFVSENIPNVSAVFLFVAIVISWPMRIAFIYYSNKKYNDVPRIWPFK